MIDSVVATLEEVWAKLEPDHVYWFMCGSLAILIMAFLVMRMFLWLLQSSRSYQYVMKENRELRAKVDAWVEWSKEDDREKVQRNPKMLKDQSEKRVRDSGKKSAGSSGVGVHAKQRPPTRNPKSKRPRSAGGTQ